MSHHPHFQKTQDSRPPFEFDKTCHYTKPPQPDWHVGQGLNQAPLPHTDIHKSQSKIKTFIPYEDLTPAECYKLMINSVVPRPIALCSTISSQGVPNLAPFSYFNAVGSNPPCIMLSCTPRGGHGKDTSENIKHSKEFVVAIISEPFIEAANYTAIDTPPEVSEWALSGLTPQPSIKVKPARIQESAINMECQLEHIYEMFDPSDSNKVSQTFIIGKIKAWHIKEEVLVDGGPLISIEKLRPCYRLGGISYGRVTEAYELLRPVWNNEKDKEEVLKLLN
ncbi:hypothetical protein O181_028556 [Austropuccinia psidii MF-1]|uniref:Flavin reductase like domain-containing protein n=1 Tax=Austropuccinia psidii MF-1 TaxID=1389203 RepID=A0A9Q3CUS0_9BASI|nr:hypothetical protein [Austropuccinia psidii MF-1]